MKFSAAQYLQISDRLREKAARCEDVEAMGRLLSLANHLWHRAQRLQPPTSVRLTPEEITRLRRVDEVSRLYFRKQFAAWKRPLA